MCRACAGPAAGIVDAHPAFVADDQRNSGSQGMKLRFGFQRNFMRGDMVIKQVQDEAGTNMVKRYRLVQPGER